MRGILFKPDMIQAIIEGRKTNTRRAEVGLRGINSEPDRWIKATPVPKERLLYTPFKGLWEFRDSHNNFRLVKPRYHIGETVYIKEAFWEDSGDIYYKLDCPEMPTNMFFEKGKWKSPLFLPEILARYFIVIEQVRAERLQVIEITPSDCIKEGSHWPTDKDDEGGFINLWDSINPKYPWESNPWVFPYTFSLKEGK